MQSIARLIQESEVPVRTWSSHILSFLLPLIQEGRLSVTGESMCTKYWLTAKEVSLPRKSVARLTDRPDMTTDVYRGLKQQHNNNNNNELTFKNSIVASHGSHIEVQCELIFIDERCGSQRHSGSSI